MPLGARLRLHVFTLTPPGHQGLTPSIRFGNRPVMNEKDAADDDQQKTETAGYAVEHQHHVSSDRARSTAGR